MYLPRDNTVAPDRKATVLRVLCKGVARANGRAGTDMRTNMIVRQTRRAAMPGIAASAGKRERLPMT
jgi:hypothetical protein